MQEYVPYAAVILAVILFFNQTRQFIRPEELEKKHREILDDAENKFASLNEVNRLELRFERFEEKIDQIYDILLERKL